jgi:(p)ppGpp synthase/HD superfamily hydrolase
LIEYDFADDLVIAGFLHDTIEDTKLTIEDVKKEFGSRVSDIVQGCSEPNKSDTWENRKRHTIEYLKKAPLDILIVSCADKLDNIRAIRDDYMRYGESFWERFNRPKKNQMWYYQSLADVFLSRIEKGTENKIFKAFASEVKNVFGDIK